MCGRVAQSDPSAFEQRLEAIRGPGLDDRRPLFNIGPTAPILGVRERHGERELDVFRWGLVPGFIDEPLKVKTTFNARGETVATKPMYRSAFRKRRLLVPVDGFYEWKTVAGEKRKQPNFFTRADGDTLVLAGLWEYWERNGQELRTATIITTANGPDSRGNPRSATGRARAGHLGALARSRTRRRRRAVGDASCIRWSAGAPEGGLRGWEREERLTGAGEGAGRGAGAEQSVDAKRPPRRAVAHSDRDRDQTRTLSRIRWDEP